MITRKDTFFVAKFLVVGMSVLFLTACVGGDNYTQNDTSDVEFNIQEKESYSKEDVLFDYDFLWNVIEDNYVFLSILRQNGVAIETLREEHRELIETQEMDLRRFVTIIDSMFQSLDYYAHLSVLDARGYEAYCEAYSVDTGFDYISGILFDPKVVSTYEEIKSYKKDGLPLLNGYNGIETLYDPNKKMAYFKIRSFNHEFIVSDHQTILLFLGELTDTGAPIEHIVIDITGNSGGDDNYWIKNIVDMFGGYYKWETWNYYRETDITAEFLSDVIDYSAVEIPPSPIEYIPLSHNVPDFVSSLGLTHFFKYRFVFFPQNSFFPDAKRWILIDKNVYSSADTFAHFCKSTRWGTLVGERTRGDGIGVVPVIIELPHTGVLIRFSVTVAETEDGESNVQKGTTPDHYCKRGEKPIDSLYRLW